MEGVNSTMICCKNFLNVTMYPQYNNNEINKKKIMNLKPYLEQRPRLANSVLTKKKVGEITVLSFKIYN
jgi:hypothetical protein